MLLLTVLGLIVLSTIIGALSGGYDKREGAAAGFFVGLFLFGGIYLISQFVGLAVNTHQIPQHTTTRIVSLADGSQIHGQFYGGLFVMRGTIDQVEYFSYYKANGDGTYSLDKQLASKSVIQPDATPETARLESDSTLTHCEPKWWSTWCSPDSGIYEHGVFHVPANSIKNDFNLDAQ